MQGVLLKIYVQEQRRHHGILLYEWLLEAGRKAGLPGGTAFRSTAGFGRRGVLHEDHFFELAGDLPVQVEFVLSDTQADALLQQLQAEGLALFYVRSAVQYGFTAAGGAPGGAVGS